MTGPRCFLLIATILVFAGTPCQGRTFSQAIGPSPVIPSPRPDLSQARFPRVVGWPSGVKPKAPAGFKVELFASGLPNPRWMYLLPNGDLLVSEATGLPNPKNPNAEDSVLRQAHMTGQSANRIELFRGMKPDGTPVLQTVFLDKLHQPFGMLLLNGWFYVANTDSVVRYRYRDGATRIDSKGEKILDLPTSGYHGHWTRNLIANPQGTKLYVSIGSSTNIAEDGMEAEKRRADILEINPDGSGERIFASGLRNPIGIAFYPGTRVLWAAVNERDWLGDLVPPDYLTHVEEGGFYGWPYAYWGSHEDYRLNGERPDLVKKTIVPDFALGCHTASLSVDFYDGKSFPDKYRGGAFIGQHGSWNSTEMQGYDVYFVPFAGGKPASKGEAFLTGFVADPKTHEVYGRPVGVVTRPDGSLLVTDDAGGRIWRISAVGGAD